MKFSSRFSGFIDLDRLAIVRARTVYAVVVVLTASCASAPKNAEEIPRSQFVQLSGLATEIDPGNLDERLLAAAIFHETNRVREQLHLPKFAWLRKLNEAADWQADSIALMQAVGHRNFLPRLAGVADRLRRVGLPPGAAAENATILLVNDVVPPHEFEVQRSAERVMMDRETGRVSRPRTYSSFAAAAVEAWMESPEHRANIVDPDLRYLGCSARPTKTVLRVDMIACIQVFYTPADAR